MITNIVATVTIFMSTNVVDTFPQKLIIGGGTPDCPTCAVATFTNIPVPNPKEKWVTTTISEVHKLTHDFDGYACEDTYSIVKTNWTAHYVKYDSWHQSETNTPIPSIWPMDNGGLIYP